MLTEDNIDFARLNYLISLNLSNSNITKRMYRAKEASLDSSKRKEYLMLCIVKGTKNLEEM